MEPLSSELREGVQLMRKEVSKLQGKQDRDRVDEVTVSQVVSDDGRQPAEAYT